MNKNEDELKRLAEEFMKKLQSEREEAEKLEIEKSESILRKRFEKIYEENIKKTRNNILDDMSWKPKSIIHRASASPPQPLPNPKKNEKKDYGCLIMFLFLIGIVALGLIFDNGNAFKTEMIKYCVGLLLTFCLIGVVDKLFKD